MADGPQEFNWVQARADCSVLRVFNELRLGAEEDVKRMNFMPPLAEYPPPQFSLRANAMGDYFVIFRSDNANLRVEFNCETKQFNITKNGRQFAVTLALSDEGKCKLRVDDGEQLESWQVRRIMLEELFFGS